MLKPPPSLVQHLREGRCVLFAGSGLSTWAGLPTWSALLRDLIGELRDEQIALDDVDEMERLVEAGKLLEVAEHCKTQLGNRYAKALSDRLTAPTGDVPEPHKIIVRLPFSGVVTTNYDTLLESSYQKLTGVSLKAPTHEDTDVLGTLLFDGSFFVLKAHGNLDRPSTIVFTASDYRDILHTNAAFNAFFSSILMSKAVLFIGYSLNDPDFRMLIDRHLSTFQKWVPERYALMPGIGAVEAKVMWESLRIRVLSYTTENGRHHAVLDFLRELERLVGDGDEAGARPEPGPARPATRVVRAVTPAEPGTYVRLSLTVQGLDVLSLLDDREGRAWVGRRPLPDIRSLVPSGPAYTGGASDEFITMFGNVLGESLAPKILEQLSASAAPGEPVLLSLPPELEALPWEWLSVDGEYFALRHPVVRVPPALSQAARGYPVIGQPPTLLLVGDPSTPDVPRLPGALEEVERIATLVEDSAEAHLLTGDSATVESVMSYLRAGDADVFHFAGHAWFDGSEHYIGLADGQLRASEFRSVLSARPPALLFLNSHYTAFVPPFERFSEAQREHEGVSGPGQLRFTDVAMAAGCGAFVGCLGSPMDFPARDVALGLYEALLRGETVARAYHGALVTLASEWNDALKYALSGTADLVLAPTEPSPSR